MYNSEVVKNFFKIILVSILGILYRLIPVRPPNVEPILALGVPFSKSLGALGMSLYGSLSILAFDIVTGTLGSHTIFTTISYGIIGGASVWYFKERKFSRKNYASFSILSVLFYDLVTGVIAIPLTTTTTFLSALIGQIPFTLLHLMGGVLFAIVLSPLVEKYLVKKEFRLFGFSQNLQQNKRGV